MNEALKHSVPGESGNGDSILLDSKSSRMPSAGARAALACFGLALAVHAVHSWLADGGSSSLRLSQIFVGIVCILASGWRRALSLTADGLLRRTIRWGTRKSELLPWADVRHVTLVLRRTELVALFEREALTGIKVLFDRDQEQALRAILERHLPEGAEVQTL